MRSKLYVHVSVLALCAVLIELGTATCTFEEPPCPEVEIPDQGGECDKYCSCADEEMVGRVFRFTQLEIDEPDKLAEMLNEIWSDDIDTNTLNVLFEITEVDRNEIGSFETIVFHGGPGWRSPKNPLKLAPDEGQPSQSVVDSYCMLDGYQVDVDVERYHGQQCEYKTSALTTLFFHSGPGDWPLVCAPLIDPQNSIPITNLKIRFGLNRDCTGMINGFIEGCITQDDANKICMWLGDYEQAELNGKYQRGEMTAEQLRAYVEPENPEEDLKLSKYCTDGCGTMWLSFGTSVEMYKLQKTCINEKGQQGYRIQGFVRAVEVTDKYDPVASANCTEF